MALVVLCLLLTAVVVLGFMVDPIPHHDRVEEKNNTPQPW